MLQHSRRPGTAGGAAPSLTLSCSNPSPAPRFLSPQEYAAYQAQQAAIAAGEPVPEMAQMQEMYAAEPAAAPEAPAAAPAPAVAPKVPGMMGGYMAPPAVPAEPIEEDAVVPMPAFVMA